jgi:flavin reductase (DIM6/NTAB) family NADH-FMN oxidoreductase RutF
VSVLSERHAEVSTQLSASDRDRFSGLPWRKSNEGAMFLDGAAAWLDCSMEREIDAGDHHIAILRVHDLHAESDVSPPFFTLANIVAWRRKTPASPMPRCSAAFTSHIWQRYADSVALGGRLDRHHASTGR